MAVAPEMRGNDGLGIEVIPVLPEPGPIPGVEFLRRLDARQGPDVVEGKEGIQGRG